MASSEWKPQWQSMSIDEMFALRDQIQEALNAKLLAKKATLERRLQTLKGLSGSASAAKTRAVKSASHVQLAER
jgi:hypothetical protein